MKKFVALLLVLCLAIGLVACTKPGTDPKNTTAATENKGNNNSTKPSGNGDSTAPTGNGDATEPSNGGTAAGPEPNSNDEYINPEAFAGKKLQIWGYTAESFRDPEFADSRDVNVMHAAIDEWAALNQVEIEFVSEYNEAQIMASINNGDNPDLILFYNYFPAPAAQGFVRAFTEAEYNKLSGIVGKQNLDVVDYKGEVYGMNHPWGGYSVFQYNRTMFENYDVKTPKEYYMEGNWTWDTMVQCWKDITKDLDGDGKMDTYGIGAYTGIFGDFPIAEDENGNLSSTVLSDRYRKRYELIYQGRTEGYVGAWAFATLSRNPRPGTQDAAAWLFDFTSFNKELSNGDILEVVPHPSYDLNDKEMAIQLCVSSIFSSCDEPEAAFSLLCYMSKCTMRWMADFSLGLYECEFEGLRGETELSKAVVDMIESVNVDRQDEFDYLVDLGEWDQEYYDMLMADVVSRKPVYYRYYFGTEPEVSEEISKLPAASALPQIDTIYQAYCQKYNELYAN